MCTLALKCFLNTDTLGPKQSMYTCIYRHIGTGTLWDSESTMGGRAGSPLIPEAHFAISLFSTWGCRILEDPRWIPCLGPLQEGSHE